MTGCAEGRLSTGFNPRLPGGRRRRCRASRSQTQTVSIHAFRGEGDTPKLKTVKDAGAFQSTPSGGKATGDVNSGVGYGLFQSTPSGGKATARERKQCVERDVSIHAFRGEGDRCCRTPRPHRCRFNPRLPGGRRRGGVDVEREHPVSIHAFRGEGDLLIW